MTFRRRYDRRENEDSFLVVFDVNRFDPLAPFLSHVAVPFSPDDPVCGGGGTNNRIDYHGLPLGTLESRKNLTFAAIPATPMNARLVHPPEE